MEAYVTWSTLSCTSNITLWIKKQKHLQFSQKHQTFPQIAGNSLEKNDLKRKDVVQILFLYPSSKSNFWMPGPCPLCVMFTFSKCSSSIAGGSEWDSRPGCQIEGAQKYQLPAQPLLPPPTQPLMLPHVLSPARLQKHPVMPLAL